MKIALAQIRSIPGDIAANIAQHLRFIESAISHEADLIVFPELSITNYEPEMAEALAIGLDDARLDEFQSISRSANLTIGVGAPTHGPGRAHISLLVFQPTAPRRLYSKQFLHEDEFPFFAAGRNRGSEAITHLTIGRGRIAFAICYELSVPEHAKTAFTVGADLYLASVAKHADGVAEASKRMPEIARTYHVPVMMVNAIGPADNFVAAGGTAVWGARGHRLSQMDGESEGLLIFDPATGRVAMQLI
jgi:predicted amidohydrolase